MWTSLPAVLFLIGTVCLLRVECGHPATGTPTRSAPAVSLSERTRTPPFRGLSFVAPPQPFGTDPMPAVRAVGANSIAVIPFAYTRPGQPRVHYDFAGGQWWGERPEGVRRTIELAHAAGLQVLLKPQVYVPGSWTGGLDFETDAEWAAWEHDYAAYLLPFADLAQELGVAALCVGTEFKRSAPRREAFWRGLIAEVRTRFDGQLTYAANWDAYPSVPFWDALDAVGIDAYFPLDAATTPSVEQLIAAWQPWKKEIAAFQQRVQKPIVFTEFGYLSVDGAAHETWELEKRVQTLPINEQAQANALAALFATFWAEPWWQGGFLWKWFPNMRGHEGYPARDYTPQGKRAEAVLTDWYTPITSSATDE